MICGVNKIFIDVLSNLRDVVVARGLIVRAIVFRARVVYFIIDCVLFFCV